MGGRKRKFNKFAEKKREKREQQQNRVAYESKHPTYEDIVRENANFDTYYQKINICDTEDEWNKFNKYIKRPLPTAFRITSFKNEAKALLNIIQTEFFKGFNDENNDERMETESSGKTDAVETIAKPFPLPWYPNGLAWQIGLTRKDIRRSEVYFRLHNFLISETESGNISRQEAVSMIPPLALDVQSHHKILDMCASPGSKTAQIIELMHHSLSESNESLPKGIVIANDIDNNRCYMLVHQAKRLNSPCIMITNHDSAVYPNLTYVDDNAKQVPLKFDRILCDVPCTGDGTLRKNPDIWLKWNVLNGNNLHGVQYRIVKRGAELLNVGGRLVYSTCSLNPIENESVIHRLLSEAQGALELVDPRPSLPGLKCSPGKSTWLLASKDVAEFYETFDQVPEKWHTVIRPQMFPPKVDDVAKYNLEKCMRILPHQQDTGGFFVAVLQKTKLLPWEASSTESNPSPDQDQETAAAKNDTGPYRKKQRIRGYREDPFVFFQDDKVDVWPSIKEFYSISDAFDPRCLLTRCHVGKKKNIYFCTPIVRDIVQANESKLKLINLGVKTFVRCDNKNMGCAFRLAQEGLHSILHFIGDERKVRVNKDDMLTMMTNTNPLEPPDVTTMCEFTREQVAKISAGSLVLQYDDPVNDFNLTFVGWKGTRSLRGYLAQPETVHMLRLIGGDTSKYDKNKFVEARNDGLDDMVTIDENVDADDDTQPIEENDPLS